MSTTWIIVALLLGFIVVFQIAKASEYVSILKGEDKTRKDNNRINAFLLLAFLVVGLFGVWYCNERLKGKILPPAASDHGEKIDTMIWITLIITFIVFVITQILLFIAINIIKKFIIICSYTNYSLFINSSCI